MVRRVKILSIIILIMIIMFTFSTNAFANGKGPTLVTDSGTGSKTTSAKSSSDVQGVIGSITNGGQNVNTDTITKFGGAIVKVAQVIGIVVAVVVILVLGIKYLVGSAEERAEYKKTFVPYIIGAILVFAATTIVNIVYELSSSLQV